jgi:adenosylmethionine-8-amino-7-oxononanoate aminotransferase
MRISPQEQEANTEEVWLCGCCRGIRRVHVKRSLVPVPVFVSGDGVMLRDREGDLYLDAEAANGTAVLGYDRSLLASAFDRASRLPGLPSFCESELRLQVAKRLAGRLTPLAPC